MPTPVFLNQRLDNLNQTEVISRLFEMSRSGVYGYLVTPNTDHLLKLLQGRGSRVQSDYRDADLVVCDSRVIELMAHLVAKPIRAYPGSDIVKDLLAVRPARPYLMGVVGPTAAQVAELAARYPAWRFVHYATPMMQVGSADFDKSVNEVLVGEWDFLLICLGFPKQEAFAAALRERGRTHGTALCVGASVDFILGLQKRAPIYLQRARLEWLHRLAHDPRRLWRRYLYEGPSILFWYFKIEILKRVDAEP